MRNGNYLPTTAVRVTVNAFNPPMVNTVNEPEIEGGAQIERERVVWKKSDGWNTIIIRITVHLLG